MKKFDKLQLLMSMQSWVPHRKWRGYIPQRYPHCNFGEGVSGVYTFAIP
jgi:hypothetical protein